MFESASGTTAARPVDTVSQAPDMNEPTQAGAKSQEMVTERRLYRRKVSGDTLPLEVAVQLAWRLAGDLLEYDRPDVLKATIEALRQWRTQKLPGSRLAYYPRKQPERNRVIWPPIIALQRKVFHETLHYEKAQEDESREGRRTLSRELLLLRFHKHILLNAENVRWQLLGVTQILHDYSDDAFVAFYNLIGQNKYENDAGNLSRVRKAIKTSLIERFKGLLVPAGKDDFKVEEFPGVAKPSCAVYRSGMATYRVLRKIRNDVLSPWTSSCHLRESHTLARDEAMPEFTLQNMENHLHDKEVPDLRIAFNCAHAAICTRCLWWAAKVIYPRQVSPYANLLLPVFAVTGGGSPAFMQRTSFDPRPDDLAEIYKELAIHEQRIKGLKANSIVVTIDEGEPDETFISGMGRVLIDVPAGAREITISVRDQQGLVVLDSEYIEPALLAGEPWEHTFVAQGGQLVSLHIFPQFDETGEPSGGKLELFYEETAKADRKLFGIPSLWSNAGSWMKAALSTRWPLVTVPILVLLLLAPVIYYFISNSDEKAGQATEELKSERDDAGESVPLQGNNNDNHDKGQRSGAKDHLARNGMRNRPGHELDNRHADRGRAPGAKVPAAGLEVYVRLTNPPDQASATYEAAFRARKALSAAVGAKVSNDDAADIPPVTANVLIDLDVVAENGRVRLTAQVRRIHGVTLPAHTVTGDDKNVEDLAVRLAVLLRKDLEPGKK